MIVYAVVFDCVCVLRRLLYFARMVFAAIVHHNDLISERRIGFLLAHINVTYMLI